MKKSELKKKKTEFVKYRCVKCNFVGGGYNLSIDSVTCPVCGNEIKISSEQNKKKEVSSE